MKKFVYFAAIALLIASCATTQKVSGGLSQKDVDRVQAKFPDYSLAQLTEGKALYEQHCGTCHPLKSPTSQTEDGWRNIVPDMVKKVNKKQSNTLDAAKEDLILKYVVTMSDAPKAE